MKSATAEKLTQRADLRDRRHVFADRAEAGALLADLMAGRVPPGAVVLAIPAGGVPVAAAVAETLGLPLDVDVVSKVTLPWNSEAGYGAVAFDGSVLLNDDLVRYAGLTEADVEEGVRRTRRKVERRLQTLRGDRPLADLTDRAAIVVDDGLASGFTMQAALRAVAGLGAAGCVVAVPTAHEEALDRVAGLAEHLYCANVRSGTPFAVAEAYRNWYDVSEQEAADLLARFGGSAGP